MYVPLALPRSSMKKRPPTKEILEFFRDTIASSVRTGQSAPRPMNSGAASGMSTVESFPAGSRNRSLAAMALCGSLPSLVSASMSIGRAAPRLALEDHLRSADPDHVAELEL